MGIQINGQTDTITAVDGSFTLGGSVTANVTTTSGTLTVGTGATVHSPASNTLTLGTNSAERVRIDSTGNFGIGTNNPQQLLELSASNNGASENNTLRFVDRDGSSGQDQQTGRIEFFTSDITQSGVQAYILGAAENAAGDGGLRFGTGTAGSAVERLRITSAGNVGIGTNSTGDKLRVNGTSRFEDYLRGNSNSNKLYISDDVAITATKKLYFTTMTAIPHLQPKQKSMELISPSNRYTLSNT